MNFVFAKIGKYGLWPYVGKIAIAFAISGAVLAIGLMATVLRIAEWQTAAAVCFAVVVTLWVLAFQWSSRAFTALQDAIQDEPPSKLYGEFDHAA